jgi:acyl-CoA dehydrogenase
VPNVAVFREQAEGLVTLVTTAAPDGEQAKDLGLLLVLGELFTLVVYGQLILEQAALDDVDRRVVDQVFDVFVRDFSAYAVELHGKASATKAQQSWALDHVRAPAPDPARFEHVWQQVRSHAGAYEMRP